MNRKEKYIFSAHRRGFTLGLRLRVLHTKGNENEHIHASQFEEIPNTLLEDIPFLGFLLVFILGIYGLSRKNEYNGENTEFTYIQMVIIRLQDKYTKQLLEGTFEGKEQQKYIEKKAFRLLSLLNRATKLDDFQEEAGVKLEKLQGNLQGFHSIRVNDQYRIIFIWKDGDADDVKFTNHYK